MASTFMSDRRRGAAPEAAVEPEATAEPEAIPSFAEIYSQNADFVWRSLRRFGVLPSALEDGLQEVFLVVHRRLHEFEGRASIKTWLFRIVMNVAREQRRRWDSAQHVVPEQRELSVESGPTPLEHALAEERLRELITILDQLGDDDRALFILVELEEISVVEAAAMLGINLNTAYTRLRTARRKFSDLAAARRQVTGAESEPGDCS